MDNDLKALLGIMALLIVIGLYVSWGLPGAIYPLEGATANQAGNSIIISVNGVPQSYNAFFEGGVVQLITGMDAPADLESYNFDDSNINFVFGSCGHGEPSLVALGRGTGFHEGKVTVSLTVPSIRDYWEGGNVMEISPWTFNCGQDQMSNSNPPMIVTGSAVFTKDINPCDGVTCNPIERTCDDGFVATCPTSCSNGVCSTCQPDCTGHQDEEEPPAGSDVNLVPVVILAVIFIGLFGFIGFKVWGWKR